MTGLTGGILAGGEGRRFGGADKGWLDYRGRALVEHARDALLPQVDELVISANRNLHRYAALGHAVVTDDIGRGPAAGLLRLLEAASHPWLLCVPVDALGLPHDLGAQMLDAQWAEETDVVVLRDAEDLYPTCCLVLASLAPDLRRYLAGGDAALWRWHARHRSAELVLATPLANLNDAAALAGHRGAQP